MFGAAVPASASLDELFAGVERVVRGAAPHAQVQRGLSFEETPVLFIDLHPAGESIEVYREKDDLVLSAKTSTVGPGYHAFVVGLLDRLGAELKLEWREGEWGGDETSYYAARDREALEREMLAWARALAGSVLRDTTGLTNIAISMPMSPQFLFKAFAQTPVGPRSREWFEAVERDASRGADLFPWWEPGLGAGFHLGVALTRMWCDVRWAEPQTDEDDDVLFEVLESLDAAYALDDSREYPWAAWAELLALADSEDGTLRARVEARAASAPATTPIGYRREDVRVTPFRGWSVQVPGSFSWEHDEHGAFSAWRDGRTVWFSAFRLRGESAEKPLRELVRETKQQGESFDFEEDELVSHAVLSEKDDAEGEAAYILSAQAAVPGRLAALTVAFPDMADREWALATWKSIRGPRADQH